MIVASVVFPMSEELWEVSRKGKKALKKGTLSEDEEIVMLALLEYKDIHGTDPTTEELKAFLREQGFNVKD